MRRLLIVSCLLILSAALVGGQTAVDGDATIENGTIEIENWSDRAYISYEPDERVHQPVNAPWNDTSWVITTDDQRVYFQDAESGDNATWRETNISMTTSVGDVTVTNITDTDNWTRVQLNADSPLQISSQSRINVTAGSEGTFNSVTVYNSTVGDNNTDLEWTLTSEDTIAVSDLEPGRSVQVVSEEGIIALKTVDDTGTIELNPRRNRSVKLRYGNSIIVDGVEISPVYKETSVLVEGRNVVSYDMENLDSSSKEINISSQVPWMTPAQEEVSISGGGERSISVDVNSNKTNDFFTRGRLRFESNNSSGVVWTELTVAKPASTAIPNFIFGIPTWQVGVVLMSLLVLLVTVLWVRIEPGQDNNVWL
jgi:hypothetical protein